MTELTEIEEFVTTKSHIAEQMIVLKGRPLRLANYPIQKAIMDCEAPEILYFGGRQISKSTFLGNNVIINCIVEKWLSTLYIAPTLNQVKEFSNIKLKSIIDNSPLIQKYIQNGKTSQNVFEKSFITNSRCIMRAASQQDGIRGIEANEILEDEIQDLVLDELATIEIVLDGQETWRKFRAGTAKNLNGPIEYYRKRSKQIVPVLRCPECGYHNIPGIDNIKIEGLMCKRCKGGRLIVRQPYLTLQTIANKDKQAVSFWVPQIALPLHVENPIKWQEVVRKLNDYPIDKFLNEVMGISSGTAYNEITEEDLVKCCKNNNGVSEFELQDELPERLPFPLYMGIDWGITQFISYTVATICGYNPETKRLTVIYMEIISNPDSDYQVERSYKLARQFGVSAVIPDAGAGFDRNHDLKKMLARHKVPVLPVQYVRSKEEIKWDEVEQLYKVDRTKSLSDTMKAIKKRKVHFFAWSRFKYFAPHFLAEHIEFGFDKNGNLTVKYDHSPDEPDDSLHSFNIVRTYMKTILGYNVI
jgi:hypothetical protein